MPNLTLFVNTSNKTLVAGQSSVQTIDPLSLPLFCNDTPTINVYLLQVPLNYNANDPSRSTLQTISTAGLALQMYLDDGKANGANIYTQQLAFTADPGGFWTGRLPLNTAALIALLGTSTSAQAYLKIGILDANGYPITYFAKPVTILAGMPTGAVAVPAGLTPLSVEVANQMFVPKQPVAGQPIYLESGAGKILAMQALDNGDGTASFHADPVN
jgi:hypothetical protein